MNFVKISYLINGRKTSWDILLNINNIKFIHAVKDGQFYSIGGIADGLGEIEINENEFQHLEKLLGIKIPVNQKDW